MLFSFPSLSKKKYHLAVAARKLMIFVKPAVSCPIECNRCLSQLSACPREQISCGVSVRSSERIVRTLRQADCPRALATGLTARLIRAARPGFPARGSLLPRVPAQPTARCRSNGPWDCGLQRPQWPWCRACSGSLCCPTQSHSDRY
jgi:hypothetical protein